MMLLYEIICYIITRGREQTGKALAGPIVRNEDGTMSITRSLCRFETYRPHHSLH
jgi:hypothetical protein